MQILKEEIKKEIIQAAINDFINKGFAQASMRNIAKNAGISTSNLYNYFKSKEELFNSISDPVYYQFDNLLNNFFEHETGKVFKNIQFLMQFATFAAKTIGQLIKDYRDRFLIVMDHSNGTRYENLKNRLISLIEEHFQEHLRAGNKENKDFLKDSFIMHIIATNLIESLLEIARHYKNDEWVDYNITALMKYHLSGMSQFF